MRNIRIKLITKIFLLWGFLWLLVSCKNELTKDSTELLSPVTFKKQFKLTNQRIVKGTTSEPKIALTYDMEYYTRDTEQLLQLFRIWNIKATFFIQGGFLRNSPRELKMIIAEGHEIGNHSWSHPDFRKLSSDTIRFQVNKNEEEILKLTGISTKPLFRCPYGSCDDRIRSVLFDLGYMEIYWTNDTNDWQVETSPQEIIQNVLTNLEPGMIVLMHNFGKYSVESTAALIREIKNKGYEITTVSDVLD